MQDLRQQVTELEAKMQNLLSSISLTDQKTQEGLENEIRKTQSALEKLILKSFLAGKYDKKNALVSIHAGQGGTEAMDWANMLLRMYLRFCQRRDWETHVLDTTAGEEAGVKSVTFKVAGAYAYGSLKGESGNHRLVRQSPFSVASF